ncbi:MAG: hypothetical protein IPM23_24595 [Candidatus Melainabacteria bacterium]|nr:hypothetical protein [Candidatus Melainabacteria bacterium]
MLQLFARSLTQSQPVATGLLGAAATRSHLANAYLLTGDNLADKKAIAISLAAFLNCAGADGQSSCFSRGETPASGCQNCRWIAEEKHPQALQSLAGAEARSKIPVERARELSAELAMTSSYGRVVVLEDASEEVFHRPAANALLKTIEEPRTVNSAPVVFLLFARQADSVLATIVSRCQVVPILAPGGSLVGPLGALEQGRAGLVKDLTENAGEEERERLGRLAGLPFFEWSRKSFSGSADGRLPHRVPPSVAVLELAAYLYDTVGKDGDFYLAVDCAVLTEVEIIGTRAMSRPILSHYLSRLLTLSETAKARLSHYVSRKSAFESFAFEWNKARECLTTG